jgi:serine/threonine protein kinase
MTNVKNCPSIELLRETFCDAGDGAVLQTTGDTLDQHLEHCEACRSLVDQFMLDDQTATWRELMVQANASDSLTSARPAIRPSRTHQGPLESILPDLDPNEEMGEPSLGVIGSYRVLRRLGNGAMGYVYLARNEHLSTLCALKIPRTDLVEDAMSNLRFIREARLAAQVRHPNVVAILAVDQIEPCAFPVLVMEFVDGFSLGQGMSDEQQRSIESKVKRAIEIASGLEAIHACGIIHRDLKPSNILVSHREDIAKIADFGLARSAQASGDLTHSGVVGTPSYMSPEQILHPQQVDRRSDLFSFGTVFYELLAGEKPFRGANDMIVQSQIVYREPSPLDQFNDRIHRDLVTIVMKCLSKEPSRRYESATELLDDLKRFASNRPIHARPISSLERSSLWCKRHPQQSLLLALLATTIATGLAIVTSLWRTAEKRGHSLASTIAQLEVQREKSDRSFALVCDTLDELCQLRLGDILYSQRPMTAAQLATLLKGQEMLIARVSQSDQGVQSRQKLAALLRQLGDTQQSLGSNDEAEKNYGQAMRVIEELGDESETRGEQAAILQGRALLALNRGEVDLTRHLLLDAIKQRKSRVDEESQSAAAQSDLIQTEMLAAAIFHRFEDRPLAIELLERANRRLEAIVNTSPENWPNVESLIVTSLQLAALYRHEKDHDSAIRHLERGMNFSSLHRPMAEQSFDLYYVEQMLYLLRCKYEIESNRWLEASQLLRSVLAQQAREKKDRPESFDLYAIFVDCSLLKGQVADHLRAAIESAADPAWIDAATAELDLLESS